MELRTFLMLLLVPAMLIELCAAVRAKKMEQKLYEFVFDENYSVNTRPSNNSKGANELITVNFDMKEKNFIDVDVKEQLIVIQVYLIMKWEDDQFIWNPKDYGGIQELFVSPSEIWTPDVLLYNTANTRSWDQNDLYKSKCRLKHTGQVIWSNVVSLRANCDMDTQWFPYDQHKCLLSFGSSILSYRNLRMKFLSENTNRIKSEDRESDGLGPGGIAVINGDWLIAYPEQYTDKAKFECCEHEFSVATYEVNLRRIPQYYLLYIFFPWFVLSCMFFMTFHIPDRIGFAMTILLSLTVYLLYVGENLPKGGKTVPVVGAIFCCVFLNYCAFIILLAWTRYLSLKTEPVWPRLLRGRVFILRFVECFCCFCCRQTQRIKKLKKTEWFPASSEPKKEDEIAMTQADDCGTGGLTSPNDEQAPHSPVIETKLQGRVSSPEDVELQMCDDPSPCVAIDPDVNWEQMTRFMDKCFFWISLFIFVTVPVLVILTLMAKDGTDYLGIGPKDGF